MKILMLGSGTSTGVPAIGCECRVCTSNDPKNKRSRASVIIFCRGRSLLIDTSTDLRIQALRHRLKRLDAVLFTHAHADHLHGIDELRIFNWLMSGPIPCYGDNKTIERINLVFNYIFQDNCESTVPRLKTNIISGPFSLFSQEVVPVEIYHGSLPILGYRLNNFAYITDCSFIPESSKEKLRDLEILILGALRFREHPTHFNIEQALEVISELKPQRCFLTHINHDLDYGETNARLPAGVELGYDGLEIEIMDKD